MSEKNIDVTGAVNAARNAKSRLNRIMTQDLSERQTANALVEMEGWLDDVLMYLGHPWKGRGR